MTGLLFVIATSPAMLEDEFNAWYDLEHIPGRLAIEGFLTAERFVSTSRPRRYLALYDLARAEVLHTPQYLGIAGANDTPWTRRIVARAHFLRMELAQTHPGEQATGRAARILVLRFTAPDRAAAAAIEAAARQAFPERPGWQLRLFEGAGADAGAVVVMAEGPTDPAALLGPETFGDAARHLDLMETFQPYGPR